jgi:hypothetical protein
MGFDDTASWTLQLVHLCGESLTVPRFAAFRRDVAGRHGRCMPRNASALATKGLASELDVSG